MYKILANTLFLGKELIYMPTCHSTNDIALELVRNTDKNEGLIVITDHQKNGKGQRGNSWESTQGLNLTFSLLLKPTFLPINRQFLLNMVVSLAVADTVNSFTATNSARVKWPNDVLIQKKKLCGILIESTILGDRIVNAIVGVGLNVNQKYFKYNQATGLSLHTDTGVSLDTVFERLVLNIEKYYLFLKRGQYDHLKEKYLENLYGYKQPVKLFSEYEFLGEISDIDDEGKLIVDEAGKRHRFDFKEVRFILP